MSKKLLLPKEFFLINLFTAFTVFVFAPIEFFISNAKDFFFSLADVVPLSALFFLTSYLFLYIFYLIIYNINQKCSIIVLTLQTAVTLSLYIQGNFLRTDYGELNGNKIDWSLYKVDSIISIAVWLIAIAGLITLCIKINKSTFKKVLSFISIWILLIQIVALTTSLLTSKDLAEKEKVVATTDYQFEMASEENFIILLLDTFDSPTFFSVYNENPDLYNNILEDFTYFKNTAGMYQYTSLSIPYIFSGTKYTDTDTYNGYIENQYANSPLLNRLSKENYRIGIYSTNDMPQLELPYTVSNLSKMRFSVSSRRRLSIFLYRLVAYRYAPFHLKEYFWFYPDADDFVDFKAKDKEAFSFDNFIFYDNLDLIHKSESDKAFFFYHLDGTHPPFNITDEFAYSSGETSIESETRGIMILVNAFFEKLKSIDAYDNSIIIITGDHGYTNLRQSPVLMVKGLNEKKNFEISNIPVSFADYQDMFSALLDGYYSSNIFDESVQKSKQREFYHYDYGKHGEFVFTPYPIPDDVFDAVP